MDDALREAIKEFLKESLTVSIEIGQSWDFSGGHRADVTLYIDGEKIASDSCSVDLSS